MRLGKAIPTALKVKGNEAALFDDGASQFEERKGAYDERVQAPQIYGKTKREDQNTIAQRPQNANGIAKVGLVRTQDAEKVDPLRISYDQIRADSISHKDSDDMIPSDDESGEDSEDGEEEEKEEPNVRVENQQPKKGGAKIIIDFDKSQAQKA